MNITMAENSEEADLIRRLKSLSPEKRDRVLRDLNPHSPPSQQQQVFYVLK